MPPIPNMNPPPSRAILLVLTACFAFSPLLHADPIKSLLPVFGDEGEEFSTKTQQGNLVHGWLPNGWVDNSEWAPVGAAYSKLDDRPDDALGAVRIKCEKIDDGQLQVTSWAGERTYLKGKRYRVVGWLRSAEPRRLTVSIRQLAEPYETYHEGEVATGTDWKPFEFDFQPEQDRKAIVVIALGEPGTVDLAGVSVAEGGPPASLLPPMGTEGEQFSHPADKGHVISGWLPTGWDDNSEWAPHHRQLTAGRKTSPPMSSAACASGWKRSPTASSNSPPTAAKRATPRQSV